MIPGLVTVVIPVYKTEKYLDRCVFSVVNQTYRDLEIILVDDGSPDRCPQMSEDEEQYVAISENYRKLDEEKYSLGSFSKRIGSLLTQNYAIL